MTEFNLENWYTTLLLFPEYFYSLRNYVNNEDSRMMYLKSIKIITAKGNLDNIKDNNSDEVSIYDYNNYGSKKFILDNLEVAFYHYSNQIFVILSSYMELILQDFFETLFFHKPELMYEFVNSDSKNKLRGYVKLDLILKSESIDKLKGKLSITAASNANKGSIVNIIKRVETIGKKTLDKKVQTNLEILIKHRNQVVHEGKLFNVDGALIKSASDDIISLLYFFADILKSKNIPLIDNSGTFE